MKVSFSWSTRRLGNWGLVREDRPNGTSENFGPMPAAIVPSFIAARRDLVRRGMLNELGATPILGLTEPDADYSYLKPKAPGVAP